MKKLVPLPHDAWQATSKARTESDATTATSEALRPPASARDNVASPAWQSLLTFFQDAGLRAELHVYQRLFVNGWEAGFMPDLLPSEESEWQNIADELAWKHAFGSFASAVKEHAKLPPGCTVVPLADQHGFGIVLGATQIAVIRATRAEPADDKSVNGNFLRAGNHWRRLYEKLASPSSGSDGGGLAAPVPRLPVAMAEPRYLTLPGSLPQEVVEACLSASERIRLDRQLAYAHPVSLECAAGELTFLPIEGDARRLHVPFRLRMSAGTVQARLLLGHRDPLPLLTRQDVTHEAAMTAWVHAILGFADVTCISFEPAVPRGTPAQRYGGGSIVIRQRAPYRKLPRHRWPGRLEPIGDWTHYGASLVAGHRRRLTGGREASDEACNRALEAGIALREDETWVRPHTRGTPDNVDIRFRWHPPVPLSELTDRRHGS